MEPEVQPLSAIPKPRLGLAIACFVFGILGLLLSVVVVGGAVAIVAIGLGVAHLAARSGPKALAIWGICIALLALPVSFGMGVLAYKGFKAARETFGSLSASITNSAGGTNWASVASAPLTNAEHTLNPTNLWSVYLPGAQAIAIGDWDSDGHDDILVADIGKQLHVLNQNGVETTNVMMPAAYSRISFLKHKSKGPRLAGYDHGGTKVTVVDATGREVWKYRSTFGLHGAQSGDLDGDGSDELIIGMNAFGGLHAVSPEGKKLWSTSMANVWDQSVIPASTNQEALVLATDVSGSIRIVDAKGTLKRIIKPDGGYCTVLAGAVVTGTNTIQILTIDQTDVIACDDNGDLAWATPTLQAQPGMAEKKIACADIDGDGVLDWAFVDATGDIVLTNTKGARLATLSGLAMSAIAMVADGNHPAKLVVLQPGKVQAYGFE